MFKSNKEARHTAFAVTVLTIVALAIMYVGRADAQTDSSVKCQSPDGEIRWFGNYTCPHGWWQI